MWYLHPSEPPTMPGGHIELESEMLLALVVWILTIAICLGFAGKFWWFPPPISAHGEAYDAQFTATLIVTGIIFFAAQMALGYAIFKYRASGRRVEYSHGNNKLEVL